MINLGDYKTGSTVRFKWNTSGTDGSSITRATNGTIRVYKDGSNVERTSGAGITDTEDFDSITGVHHCDIDLSDNTDAGFYAAGSDYFVVLVGAVIDGKTVNVCLAQFGIEKSMAWLVDLIFTTPIATIFSRTGIANATRCLLKFVRGALPLNKVDAQTGQVFQEDDATEAFTFSTTSSPTANPITKIDPT